MENATENSPAASSATKGNTSSGQKTGSVKFIASTLKLLGQNQSGDLRPRVQQVSSVGVPIVPTSGNLFHNVLRHRPASALRQNREVFVIFQPFPDLLQSDRRDETLNTHIHPRIQQRAFHVVLIPVGQGVGPDVSGRSPVRRTPLEQAHDFATPPD